MNHSWHAILSAVVAALLLGCSSKTDVLASELQLALGQEVRGEYSVESLEGQAAIGSGALKATIHLTAAGHKRALAAIPVAARQPTATGFEYSTYRKNGGGFRYFIIHLSEQERKAYVQLGDQ